MKTLRVLLPAALLYATSLPAFAHETWQGHP